MKVLFVHEGYIFRKDGNICSYAYNKKIVQRYKMIADHVVFLSREDASLGGDGQYNIIDEPNFEFVGVKNFKSLKGLRHIPEVKRIVQQAVKDADYIVARTSDLGYYAVRYAKKYGKMVLVEVVGCSRDALWYYSLKGKFLALSAYMREKAMVRDADYALYVTEHFLQDRYPSKGKSLACSDVEITNFDDHILKKRIEKIRNMEDKTIVMGTLAAVDVRYKGYETVIKAIRKLEKQGYHIRYKIAGPGNPEWLRKVVRKNHLEKNVIIESAMSHEDVFIWLDDIDIYIQPSYGAEGLPRALVEAMSRACPCIGSTAGGIVELLSKQFIFKKRNEKALRRVIRKYTKENMIESCRANFRRAQDYSQEALMVKRKQFFCDFVQRN